MRLGRSTLAAVSLALCACGGVAGSDSDAVEGAAGPVSDIPDAGRVTCRPGGPELSTPVVRPQADGVHFIVENRTAEPLYFLVLLGIVEQDVAPGATVEVVGPVAPGDARAGCYSPEKAEPEPDELTPVEVQDPQGLWRSPELDCQGSGAWELIIDYLGGPGRQGSPEDVAAAELRGLRPDDEVRRVQYPEQERPVVGVIREGRTIVTVDLSPGEGSGWLVDGGTGCVGEGVDLG